jgi:hypothetical protein
MLSHAPRQFPSWLIFDVKQREYFTVISCRLHQAFTSRAQNVLDEKDSQRRCRPMFLCRIGATRALATLSAVSRFFLDGDGAARWTASAGEHLLERNFSDALLHLVRCSHQALVRYLAIADCSRIWVA